MKELREIMLPIIAGIEEQNGLNLASDMVTYELTYPERPDVRISIQIGGMFPDSITEEDTIQ